VRTSVAPAREMLRRKTVNRLLLRGSLGGTLRLILSTADQEKGQQNNRQSSHFVLSSIDVRYSAPHGNASPHAHRHYLPFDAFSRPSGSRDVRHAGRPPATADQTTKRQVHRLGRDGKSVRLSAKHWLHRGASTPGCDNPRRIGKKQKSILIAHSLSRVSSKQNPGNCAPQ
jgi:hypothetical protein